MTMQKYFAFILVSIIWSSSTAWSTFQPGPPYSSQSSLTQLQPSLQHVGNNALYAVKEPKDRQLSSIEETTEQYGLEAGLFESMKKKDGGETAKDLLAKYGVAYLATSIPLAIVSFSICYALVDSGVDVAALLNNVGITVGDTGEKVGTFAIAYTAHKAASPIRFPPTVLLTPVVAKMIGREPTEEASE